MAAQSYREYIFLSSALRNQRIRRIRGALALVSILAPFAGWGASKVLVMAVARNRRLFAIYWGNALVSIAITATFLLIILKFVGHYALPVSATTSIPGFALAKIFNAVTNAGLGFSGVREVERYRRCPAPRVDRSHVEAALFSRSRRGSRGPQRGSNGI